MIREQLQKLVDFDNCPCQTCENIISLAYHAGLAKNIQGDVVEFGCADGGSAVILAAFSGKTPHLYDSFKGLPEADSNDGDSNWFPVGTFSNCHPSNVQLKFTKQELNWPIIHKEFFRHLKPEDIPEKISLCHFDGDRYSSTIECLLLVYDRLTPGGIFLAHDYASSVLPGVKLAIDWFMKDKSEKLFMASPGQVAFYKI